MMTTATRTGIVTRLLAGGAVALMASAHAATAQERYPVRPIRLINPYAPGGLTDVVSRLLARHITEAWGQQVIVDSRGGGGTTIGTEIVVRAASDGYTMLCTTAAISMMPTFYPKLGFSTRKDLIPVALVSQVPGALALNPGVPARSVRELIDLARAKPGQIAFGSAGTGSFVHLSLELFKSMTKVDIAHVPYKGGSLAVIDTIGGQLQGLFNPLPLVAGHAKNGRLRLLGVASLQRSEFAPELPTIAESGVPGFEAVVWSGVFATAGAPRSIVDKWNAEINRMQNLPNARETFNGAGLTRLGGTREEFAAYFARETQRWAEIIRAAGIPIEQ
jgi:tripartite-type tricarboxylate transporter receptor subunit TctC